MGRTFALQKESGWSKYVSSTVRRFKPLTDVKKAFTSALRKAGIAAAFNAPIAAVTFTIEEVV